MTGIDILISRGSDTENDYIFNLEEEKNQMLKLLKK